MRGKRAMRVVYPDGEIEIDFLARNVVNTTGRKLQSLELRDPLAESVGSFVEAARMGAATLVRPEEAYRGVGDGASDRGSRRSLRRNSPGRTGPLASPGLRAFGRPG
jgi:hypothetical protein